MTWHLTLKLKMTNDLSFVLTILKLEHYLWKLKPWPCSFYNMHANNNTSVRCNARVYYGKPKHVSSQFKCTMYIGVMFPNITIDWNKKFSFLVLSEKYETHVLLLHKSSKPVLWPIFDFSHKPKGFYTSL